MEILYAKTFHSSTNMPALKSVVIGQKNDPGQELSSAQSVYRGKLMLQSITWHRKGCDSIPKIAPVGKARTQAAVLVTETWLIKGTDFWRKRKTLNITKGSVSKALQHVRPFKEQELSQSGLVHYWNILIGRNDDIPQQTYFANQCLKKTKILTFSYSKRRK